VTLFRPKGKSKQGTQSISKEGDHIMSTRPLEKSYKKCFIILMGILLVIIGGVVIFRTWVREKNEFNDRRRNAGLVYLGKNSEGHKEYLREIDNAIMVYIPEGSFFFGKNNYRVHLSGYFIDKYEISNEQFCFFLNNNKTDKEDL
jgi:hypothetical protein